MTIGENEREIRRLRAEVRRLYEEQERLVRERGEAQERIGTLERQPIESGGSAWREAIERALGVEADAENHTPKWAEDLVMSHREIGNRGKG